MKRKIIMIGVTIICVISLLTLSCFASDFQIDNLQSYSLVFNNRVYEIEEASAFVYTFDINFTVGSNNNNLSMRAMRISNDGLAFIIEYMSLQNHQWVTAYDNGWTNNEYKYIVIKSGADCSNQWLCNFVNNSVVTANIVHQTLTDPYTSLFAQLNNTSSISTLQSYLSQYSSIENGTKVLGFLGSPASYIYENYMMTPLVIGGIIIALFLWFKRTNIQQDLKDVEDHYKKSNRNKIGFKA